MKPIILSTLFFFSCISAHAEAVCVSGVRGTSTSAYTFRVTQTNGERNLTLAEVSRGVIFSSKVVNRFTQFDRTGYGVCSLTATGTDEVTGASYKIELKVPPRSKKLCAQVMIPSSVEYLTLKIVPNGTTLGDDLTAYAITTKACP